MVSSGPTPQAKQHHLHHGPTSSRRQGLSGSASRASRATRSIYRRLLNFVKQAWTGVKFALGKHRNAQSRQFEQKLRARRCVCKHFRMQSGRFLFCFIRKSCSADSFDLITEMFLFSSSADSELEELEAPPSYRPDSLEALCKATRFSESELKRIYRGFKAECPSGVVREDTFKGIYSQFFPQGGNNNIVSTTHIL